MNKNVKSFIEGAFYGILTVAIGVMVVVSVVLYNEGKEIERENEKTIMFMDVLSEYGYDAYDCVKEIDEQWTEEGHLGIGTFEFHYWGDTLRVNCESIDGTQQCSRPVID